MTIKSIAPIQTDSLHFDHANPRLAEYGINGDFDEDQILEILWDAMDVQELVQSISASGFFEHEALTRIFHQSPTQSIQSDDQPDRNS